MLKEAKAVKPQIKSIIISAYPSTELAAEAIKLGAVDYLIKPVAPDDLKRLIQETLVKCERGMEMQYGKPNLQSR